MTAYRPMPFFHNTERLTLRPWADADADDYRDLVAERGDGVPTHDNIRQRIASQRAATERTGIALLAVCRRADNDLIGYCGLTVGRATVDEPEIAYELFRRVHGQGYATEAARAILEAASETGRTRLWSTVGTWNAPSLRVLEKLAFQRDRVAVDDRGEFVWLTRTLP